MSDAEVTSRTIREHYFRVGAWHDIVQVSILPREIESGRKPDEGSSPGYGRLPG